MRVIASGGELMLHKLFFDIVVVSFLPFMISHKNIGGIKSPYHDSHHKINYFLSANQGIVQTNKQNLDHLELPQ